MGIVEWIVALSFAIARANLGWTKVRLLTARFHTALLTSPSRIWRRIRPAYSRRLMRESNRPKSSFKTFMYLRIAFVKSEGREWLIQFCS
jgi:hypothetical protein